MAKVGICGAEGTLGANALDPREKLFGRLNVLIDVRPFCIYEWLDVSHFLDRMNADECDVVPTWK